MVNTTLKVTGMHCEGCENRIQKLLPKIESVSNVDADRNKETVVFESNGSDVTLSAVKDKIVDLGYQVVD